MRASFAIAPAAALGIVAAAALAATPPAAAKTLVFCSEGNPEALNPQIVTTTTGMNAGRPMFNNLVEFEKGTTTIVPASRRAGPYRRMEPNTCSACAPA